MSEFDRVLFDGELVRIGTFRCPADHPRFTDSGPIEGHIVVFPRTCVLITHEDARPIVTTPNVALFYNRGQRYRRDRLAPAGDLCDWYAFPPDVVEEASRAAGVPAAKRAAGVPAAGRAAGVPARGRAPARDDGPFRLTHGPASAEAYARQRRLIRALHATDRAGDDPLAVEGAALALLARALRDAAPAGHAAPAPRRAATVRDHEDLAQAARELLARRFAERLTLRQVARAVHSSPYHLARVFRAHTGSSLHAYRDQLRARVGLDAVLAGDDLARTALELGYASHSHFTLAFRRVFGTTPSALRGSGPPDGGDRLRALPHRARS